ncbi:hypothetical protein L873DRAFT_880014 [Choiromyces venosus 120613-1]|uniref:Ferric oxidoreductase domain-containing protein n=1 Tax=Choiromyces venosus 120613-1 TaxID=1336337 RepID=A0A3N4JNB7_9PEZI|nr:hypothetical protein L873DRAFT_880014 [Choiromyces venosus 120613-1]
MIVIILRGKGTLTRLHFLLIACYVLSNILLIALGTSTTAQLVKKSALMSLVNLMPLYLGRMNLVIDDWGISSENYDRIHRWIGRIAFTEAAIRVVLSLTGKKFVVGLDQLPGILAASGMLCLFLLSLWFFRQYCHEFFFQDIFAICRVPYNCALASYTINTFWPTDIPIGHYFSLWGDGASTNMSFDLPERKLAQIW